MKYELRITDKLDAKLLNEWRNLWEKSPHAHMFNGPDWFQLDCKLHENRQYKLIALYANKNLTAIVPLVREKKAGIPTFQFPGGKYLDRASVLMTSMEKSQVTKIIKALKQQGNLYLGEMAEELTALIRTIDTSFLMKKSSVSPYLELADDPFRFMASAVRNKMTNRIEKNKNHLARKTYRNDALSLKIAEDIDMRSAKMKRGMATFTKKEEKKFFSLLQQEFKNMFVIDVIYFDTIPIAYSIGLQDKTTYYAINTSYDDSYKYLQPGKTMVYFIMQRLQKEERKIFDFSRGDNAFKRNFTPVAHTQYTVYYTKNVLVQYWWTGIDLLREYAVTNKIVYGSYCTIRKLFYTS